MRLRIRIPGGPVRVLEHPVGPMPLVGIAIGEVPVTPFALGIDQDIDARIGLAAKNADLIVELTEEQRDSDPPILGATGRRQDATSPSHRRGVCGI